MALAAPISSDVLETRDGRLLEGTYLGGTQRALRFEAQDGIEVFLTEEVLALTFTGSVPRAAQEPSQAAAPQAAPVQPPLPTSTPTPPAPPLAATPTPTAPALAAAPTPPAPAAAVAPAPAVPAAPPASSFRVPAGTALRVRLLDGIDSRKGAVGDRFSATLEGDLGADGVTVVAAGSKLYGQIAELRTTGPIPSRLRLELTQLMLQGELIDIVTGSRQLAATTEPWPASASKTRARAGVAAGSVLEFRLLQPFEVRIR